MSDLITLEALSKRLGGIPLSTLKHRIHQLGIPTAARGARNKLFFDEAAVALLEAADRLIKDGHGIAATRERLGLTAPALEEGEAEPPELEPEEAVVASQSGALEQLAVALSDALAQLAAKDRQLDKLQDALRRTSEAAATFQQKTFYLQGELQRLKGELRELRQPTGKEPGTWQRLFKKEP